VTPPPVVQSRPVRLTRVCWALVVVVMAVFTTVALALAAGEPGDATFRLPDQLAMIGLGVLLSLAMLSLTRARVRGELEGVRVRNVVGERFFPWEVVREVRLDDGAPWASLELHDDDTVSLLGAQTNDGERSSRWCSGLRAPAPRPSRRDPEPPADAAGATSTGGDGKVTVPCGAAHSGAGEDSEPGAPTAAALAGAEAWEMSVSPLPS
jgi:hypothetical protein